MRNIATPQFVNSGIRSVIMKKRSLHNNADRRLTSLALSMVILLSLIVIPVTAMASGPFDFDTLYKTSYDSVEYSACKIEVGNTPITRTVTGYVWPMVTNDLGIGDSFLLQHAIEVELRPAFSVPAEPGLSTIAVLQNANGLGQFTLENVPFGEYVLYIYRPGYLVRCMPVTVSESDGPIIELAPPTNSFDNGVFRLWCGDCNGDLRIDASDAIIIVQLMNTGVNDQLYDPACDLNADGVIDGSDIAMIMQNFDMTIWHYAGVPTDDDFFTADPVAVEPADHADVTVYHHYEDIALPVQENVQLGFGDYALDELFMQGPNNGSFKVYEITDEGGNSEILAFEEGYEYTVHIYYKLITCTVTFNPNTSSPVTGLSPVSKTVYTGQTYGTLPIPSRDGYSFDGWWTRPGIGGTMVISTTIVTDTEDHTLYAHWTPAGGPRPTPASTSATLTATKTVTGAGAPGKEFSFAVYEGDTVVATSTRSGAGNITFSGINYTTAGTHTYTMRETSTDGDGWTMDKTVYTVTVRVTNNNNVLVATVEYPNNTLPAFVNTYERPSTGTATLSISKRLVSEGNIEVETSTQFTVRLFDGAMVQIGEYTLSANGAAVTIPNLSAGTSYTIKEDSATGYTAVGYMVFTDDALTGSANGPAVNLSVAGLSKDTTIEAILTNTLGTWDWSDDDPIDNIDIDNGDVPLAEFIGDHVAYIIGYPEGDVRPLQDISRAEVATVFFRLLTDEVRAMYWTQENLFPDVEMGHWYNNAVSVMFEMGIVNGYPDGTFNPNGAITRGELAAIAARFARAMGTMGANSVSFSDIAGHWAENDIMHAALIGWVNGYPDGTYRPDQPITRAECMTLVNRMLERIPKTAEDVDRVWAKQWPDNADTSVWYYIAVQEATNSHLFDYYMIQLDPDDEDYDFEDGDGNRFRYELVESLYLPYETWTEPMENRDWYALEREWSDAHAG